MASTRDIIKASAKREDQSFESKRNYARGVTVGIDYSNDCSVDGKANYIWVREESQDGAIYQCFNPSVQTLVGLPVLISKEPAAPFRRMVIGVNWSAFVMMPDDANGMTYNLVRHRNTHEWPDMAPGIDAVSVFPRAIAPLRVYTLLSDVSVGVAPARYSVNGAFVTYDGTNYLSLVSYVPGTVDYFRTVLVGLSVSTNTAVVVDGELTLEPAPIKQAVPAGIFPLAYIRLYYGMTYVSEADIVEDPRVIFSISDVTNQLAAAMAEIDVVLSKHIVEG
jgi:hypothetical protein